MGLDIGTTSTKTIITDGKGVLLGAGEAGYPLDVPQPSWAEQDPDLMFEAVLKSIQEAIQKSGIDARQLEAIGFSTAMHSVIPVDADGKPLMSSIIWADNRSVAQVQRLKDEKLSSSLYHTTGIPMHPMTPLPKLMWLRENRQDIFAKAVKYISIKEYILHKFFGRYIVDHSIASGTCLFNLNTLAWDADALEIAGIREDQLSEIVPTTHIMRGMKSEFADLLGLNPDVPFVVGAADGALANLGVGAVEPGVVAITIGTSGAVRTVVPKPLTDPKERTFCYALTENHWVIGGASNNGGLMLRWFRDEFSFPEVEEARRTGKDPYDIMIASAKEVAPGSDGLLFLPFLSGERAPYWNADARGSFFGIGLHHKRPQFIRAVLEGILFTVFGIGVALRDLAGPAKEIRASGGFARSPEWRQIMADMFGYPVHIPKSHESSSFGAVALAMHAVGALERLEDVNKLISITDRQEPNIEHAPTYLELYSLYDRVYHKLKDEFSVIAEFQRRGHK
ncbi:gluconokinase [Paenibacillus sp. FJAT-26967]|uniref:gluconokinase n=1 Tax=Paenibacillus sp. FJAT-26967 TaxID=1729690 RepID=UPI0008387E5C|nr:gluconokinase [Paenibacillus sp. FJAT-26967]